MTSLKKNINNLIKSYKKKGILESDRSDLMTLILLMVVLPSREPDGAISPM